jgi:NADH:ubiquinone oxidoreductase subunit F (NADH-binding)
MADGGCLSAIRALAAEREAATGERVDIEEVSCLGRCDRAPAALVHHAHPVTGAEGAKAALDGAHAEASPPASDRRFRADYDDPSERYATVRRVAAGGDAAAEATLAALKEAGLRGMGGAGFPTAMKWGFVRKAGPDGAGEKYVVCNADESEPGTFKDREILANLPHLVWEGVLIAAVVVGAQRGIVYIRHEYEPERQALAREQEVAAKVAAELGIDLEIFVSPGGYIMGEETALLEALEDRRGEPRNKPPFPGIEGLFGKPTLINNVETLAMTTAIVHRGAAWWKGQGVRGCAGLKFIGISGDVERPGCHEVAMGTTIRELIDLAGGVKGGAELAAVLPGGASSAFLPADRVDTPLDFDRLKEAGSTLGSGAVVAIAADRDLLALGLSLPRFFRNESCGKCVPCRVGSEKAVTILEDLEAGRATTPTRSLALLEDLDATMGQTSICGLGQVALLPALSLFRNFPELRARLEAERAS